MSANHGMVPTTIRKSFEKAFNIGNGSKVEEILER